MKRHNFFLPEELVSELRRRAKEMDLTVSELIRRAIVAYLAKP
jgi:metal-responsive CopG/Arc/MetJ family transcriptional regulator